MTKSKNTKSKTTDQDAPLVRIKFSDPQKEKLQQLQMQKDMAIKQQLVAKPTETILVKHVPDSHMDRFDFKSLFEVFGTVTQFTTFVDEEGVNCGAIKFDNVQSAINTVKALNNKKLGKYDKSRPLLMSYQQTKQFPGAPPKKKSNKPQQQQQNLNIAPTAIEKQIKANRAMMQQMEQMGFAKAKAEAALIAVENSSVEDAIEWSCSNFPETVPIQSKKINEVATTTTPSVTADDKKKKKKTQKQKPTTSDNTYQEEQQHHAISTNVQPTATLHDQPMSQQQQPRQRSESSGEIPVMQQDAPASSASTDSQEEQKLKVSQLVSKMKFLVSQDDYTRFRKLSADFQKGEIGAAEYYKKFYNMFKNDEEAIFFLLLETMPKRDMHKIESLILARHAFHNNASSNTAAAAVDSTSSNNQQQQQQPLPKATKPVQKNTSAANTSQQAKKKKQPAQQQQQKAQAKSGKQQQAKPATNQQQAANKSARIRQSNNPFAVLADDS